MNKPLLIIGNKNYSSWSLRPWLALKMAQIDFDERTVALFGDGWAEQKAKLPSGTVPVLRHDDLEIPETLAIIEYAAETWPDAGLWPRDAKARARARAVSSEMHAGFHAIRNTMAMNVRNVYPGRGRGQTPKAQTAITRDIRRIETIWTTCREAYGGNGDFLFGKFCAADAMFAPVVSRFTTYAVKLNPTCQTYMDAVQNLPAMIDWSNAARVEPWTIKEEEIDFIEGA